MRLAVLGEALQLSDRACSRMQRNMLFALMLTACVTACAFAQAQPEQATTRPGRLEVYPPSVELTGAKDYQHIVIRSVGDDGITRDVTDAATIESGDTNVVFVSDGRVRAWGNGESHLAVTYDGQTLQMPVKVTKVDHQRAVSLRLDVIPTLTSAGCNNGSCHGSARGQDGFHLSLFGYDPNGDHYAMTRELPGRRLNFARPAESLLVKKAVGRAPHTGGKLFELDSHHAQTLIEWIERGAPNDPADIAHVTHIDVFPPDMVLTAGGESQRMIVRSYYSDGTNRDVTELATLMSNNDVCARVDASGRVTPGQRGEAQLLARFDVHSVGIPVIVIPADAPTVSPPQPANYIDEFVHKKLVNLRIQPSDVCTDDVFLRRAYIDLTGMLPTPEAHAAFIADERPDKRARLIDELLQRKEFVELWVMQWAERMQIRSTLEVSYKAMLLYYNWLQERLAADMPLNEIVRELLSATGGTFTSPATNFYQLERDTLKLSENVAQSFLGARMQCAQCHNHPFDRWTMDDYYSFAAFFAQVGRKQAEDPRETIVFNNRNGDVNHPVGNRAMLPRFLGGPSPDIKGRDRRVVLAEWLTSKDNDMFARNVANMVWAHFFGRGIVDPVDDVRVSNPPSNGPLLAALAERLVEYNYDLRKFVRDICNSRTYQLSSKTNPTNAEDHRNFSHAAIRRIRSEVLLDCISQVTGAPNKFKGLPLGARAVQIADGNVSNYFLTTFGRAKRETVCTCEVVMEPNLSQALHLINGDSVNQKIAEGGLVKGLVDSGKTPEAIVDQLYLACLSRVPTDAERAKLHEVLSVSEDKPAVLNDLLWALLNSKEFMFNH